MLYDQQAIRARAIDFSRQGIVITDARRPDNPIVDVNPAFEVMTGYTKADIIGQNCRFLQGEHRNEATARKIRDAITAGTHVRVEIKNVRHDGTRFWNELTISPIRDDAGEVTHFVGIQQDITDRILAEAELKAANADLQRYQTELHHQAAQQRSIDDRINGLLKQAGYGRIS